MTSDVSEVLAPCPFCGSGARFVKHSAGVRGTMAFDSWDAVACAGCGATVGACDRRFRNKDDARKAWNTRAQPAVLAVPGWRPIDEAPKDGSMILLGMPDRVDDDGGEVSTPGYWQKGWEDSVDDMGCDDGFVDVHFQEFSPPRSFGAEAYRSKGRQPTHWMPLPPAPTEAT